MSCLWLLRAMRMFMYPNLNDRIMTQEQYQRAIEINKRLNELNQVKSEIHGKSTHYLTYMRESNTLTANTPCNAYVMTFIAGLLDMHDKQIREEIDNEIKELEQEIDRL